MIRKIKCFLVVMLIGAAFMAVNSGCSGGDKMMCERDRTYKSDSRNRNRTNYGSKYALKAKPAKKDYVIQNKRTGKKY